MDLFDIVQTVSRPVARFCVGEGGGGGGGEGGGGCKVRFSVTKGTPGPFVRHAWRTNGVPLSCNAQVVYIREL